MRERLTDNDFEKKILDLLSKKILSVSQIAKNLEIRRDVVAGYLEALKNQGKLKFHRVGRSNVYTVPQKQKMNKFLFFSLILFLIIIPLASITPVVENIYRLHGEKRAIVITPSLFMSGVRGTNFLSIYNTPLFTPPTLTSRIILKVFYNMQEYSWQKEFW